MQGFTGRRQLDLEILKALPEGAVMKNGKKQTLPLKQVGMHQLIR